MTANEPPEAADCHWIKLSILTVTLPDWLVQLMHLIHEQRVIHLSAVAQAAVDNANSAELWPTCPDWL